MADQIYRCAWITDLEVRAGNVEEIAWIGKSRWKIENEHFNTHKNGGYELEHNYGHGKKTLSVVFYFLNLLAFVAHKVMGRSDPLCQKLRQATTLRDLWQGLRHCFDRFLVESRKELLKEYDPEMIEGSG